MLRMLSNKLNLILAIMVGCAMIAAVAMPAYAQLTDEERAELKKQLIEIEEEILETQSTLTQTKQETASYERDRAILDAEINQAQLNIRQKNLTIDSISSEIDVREEAVQLYEEQIDRHQQQLANVLRQTNTAADKTLVEMVLSNQGFSEFFQDYDRIQEVRVKLKAAIADVRNFRDAVNEERERLGLQKIEQVDVRKSLELQKQSVEIAEEEKSRLIDANRNKEAGYQELIAQKQAEADKIRAALFALRDAGAIPFGTALEFANSASRATGVPTSLILAILQQESNLGSNVGTCNRPGDSRTWRDIMPGPGESWRDDQAAFVRITSALGISPDGQPLSCPVASGGWGGAMGPSQFIPTTWESYAPRIAATTGVAVANPWDPFQAIHATAIYMADLGAASTSYSYQREAACKYYSGKGCGLSSMNNTFYGDGVMDKANTIQVCQIDPIENDSIRPSWCPIL
jgi:membrane-bound lytic murein transglycosylase B